MENGKWKSKKNLFTIHYSLFTAGKSFESFPALVHEIQNHHRKNWQNATLLSPCRYSKMGNRGISETFNEVVKLLTGMTKIDSIVIPSLTWLYNAASYSRH